MVYGYNDKYIKTKTKSYKINTNFRGNEIPKGSAWYKSLSLILLGSDIIANKKYHPQAFLEECKYIVTK